jgi:threonine/homoserine/homoserine lactone efflux protein
MMLYITFALSVLMLILSPGPIVSLIISEARHKIPRGVIIGAVLSSQVLLLVSLFTIFNSISFNRDLLRFGQVIGGCYLLYIAFCSICEKRDFKSVERGGFIKALKIGLSNPKDILFFVAFLPSFIQVDGDFFIHAFILMTIWLVIDVLVMVFYGYFSAKLFDWRIGQLFIAIVPNVVMFIFGSVSIYKGVI